MPKHLPTPSACEVQNLERIAGAFGPNILALDAQQLASLISTTANNVAQWLHRGHIPFNTVRIGSRVFFPVPHVAAWLCGQGSNDDPLCIPVPKKTSLRVRSSADLKARLAALMKTVEEGAQALQQGEKVDNAKAVKSIKESRETHSHAVAHVVALVSKIMLLKSI